MVSESIAPATQEGGLTHPFDAAAAGYDESFTATKLGRWYRNLLWERLGPVFSEGDQVLELGCGTGEDAVWLARRGVRVTATDASSVMLGAARVKARSAGVDDLVTLLQADLNADFTAVLASPPSDNCNSVGQIERSGQYDGSIASFGPINCVGNRAALAGRLARVIRPGGHLVMTVMGPICPWELLWHAARLEFSTALRRFRSGAWARVGDGGSLPVWYPSPGRLEREFSQYFVPVERAGLGLLLPPTGMARLVERYPRFFRPLAFIDRRAASLATWRYCGDHYLLVMKRRSE